MIKRFSRYLTGVWIAIIVNIGLNWYRGTLSWKGVGELLLSCIVLIVFMFVVYIVLKFVWNFIKKDWLRWEEKMRGR